MLCKKLMVLFDKFPAVLTLRIFDNKLIPITIFFDKLIMIKKIEFFDRFIIVKNFKFSNKFKNYFKKIVSIFINYSTNFNLLFFYFSNIDKLPSLKSPGVSFVYFDLLFFFVKIKSSISICLLNFTPILLFYNLSKNYIYLNLLFFL